MCGLVVGLDATGVGAMVVLEQVDEAERLFRRQPLSMSLRAWRQARLGVIGAAQSVVEGGGSELMFVPRALEMAGVGGGGGVAHMFLGSGEGCGIHGCGRRARACRGRWMCACECECEGS